MTWEQNQLMHFGIPGQKWGIRRYQNEDGTLTEEGRQRYGYGDGDGDSFDDRGSGQKTGDGKDRQESSIARSLRETPDEELAKSKEVITQAQRRLLAQSLIQGVSGLSMMAIGNRVSRKGRIGIGALMYGMGAAHVLRAGVRQIVGTTAGQFAKGVITQEEKARQKRA